PYREGFGTFAWRIPILVTISKTVLRHLKLFKVFKVQLGEDRIRARRGDLRAEEEGEEGTKLSNEDIKKAYRSKALELHPDKRIDDPNAVVDFQQLQASYDILKDEKTRKEFDNAVMIQVNEQKRQQERSENRMKSSERKRTREVVHPAPEQKERSGLGRDRYKGNTRMVYDCYIG
nr:DnaJ homolog subfamily C member 17 [Tanacetum cinerariifolium]